MGAGEGNGDEGVEPSLAPIREDRGRERFGRYELVAEIASGGMATVYLARLVGEAGVARAVALKRVHAHLARNRAFAEMFLDEARIASRIDHPNVCQVLEYGRERGVSFLSMELLVGETLARVGGAIARGASPDVLARLPAVAATVIAEACDGLQAAHDLTDAHGRSLRVVHRDVSPQNVIVTFDGGVKVVDFGVASAANKLHHTETGEVKGKLAYMSPEQLAGHVDARTDVWAVGVVLWELLTVRRLFRRPTPAETIAAVQRDPIAPPSSVRPEVPAAFDDVVMRALARDPSARYASARELARDLRAVLRARGDVIDRASIADWMGALFPDGAERRRRWVELAEQDPTSDVDPFGSVAEHEVEVDVAVEDEQIGPTRSWRGASGRRDASSSSDAALAAGGDARRATSGVLSSPSSASDLRSSDAVSPSPTPAPGAMDPSITAEAVGAAGRAHGAWTRTGTMMLVVGLASAAIAGAVTGGTTPAALPTISSPPEPPPPPRAVPAASSAAEVPTASEGMPVERPEASQPVSSGASDGAPPSTEPVGERAPRTSRRSRATRGRDESDLRGSTSQAVSPPAQHGEPACLLVASGIRVRIRDAWHEGPLGPRQCVRVPAGTYALEVVDLVGGERLWSGRHTIESGALVRVTRTGVTR